VLPALIGATEEGVAEESTGTYYCGGIWYRPSYQGSNVIYIVEDIDAGANTDVEFED
jgi:hypothetical protein